MQKIFLLFIIALCGTLSWVASKYALAEISPWMLTLLRYIIACIAIAPFIGSLRKYNWKEKGILVAICLGVSVNSIFYAYGISLTTISAAQVMYLLTPVFVLMMSYFFFHEKIQSRKIYGLTFAISGACIIFILPKIYGSWLQVGSLLGNFYILLAVLSYCSYLILSKKHHYSTMELLVWTMIGGLISSSIFAMYSYTPGTSPIEHLTLEGFLWILYASLIGTVWFYFLIQKLMKISNPFFVGFTSYVQLMTTMIAWHLLFDEHIGIGFLIGSALTIYWVYYINKVK